jgi:transposase
MMEHTHVWAGQRVQVLRRFCECGEERFILDEKKQWPRRVEVRRQRSIKSGPRPRNLERWREYEAAYLRGLSAEAVATQFGVSASQVRYGLKQLGTTIRPKGTYQPANKGVRSPAALARAAEIVELARSGLTYTEIGNQFGITRERVRQLLKLAGLSAEEVHAIVTARHNLLHPPPTHRTCGLCGKEVPVEDWAEHRRGISAGTHKWRKIGEKAPPGLWEAIAADYSAGVKTHDIMAKYHVPAPTIQRVKFKFGLPDRNNKKRLSTNAATQERAARILIDIEAGKPRQEIASTYGVSNSLVWQIAKKNGLRTMAKTR